MSRAVLQRIMHVTTSLDSGRNRRYTITLQCQIAARDTELEVQTTHKPVLKGSIPYSRSSSGLDQHRRIRRTLVMMLIAILELWLGNAPCQVANAGSGASATATEEIED